MSNYDFIANDDEQTEENDDTEQFNTVGSMWTLGDHSSASTSERTNLSKSIEETLSQLDDDIDGDMKAVLQDASDLVNDTRVSDFECPIEECGLGHSHPDHKHDIRSAFNVTSTFADSIQFCPYCHCGANEMAMLVQFYPYITEEVFTDSHKFENVLEVEPVLLDELYREYNEGSTVKEAVRIVASQRGIPEGDVAGHGIRGELTLFFRRRQSIENAANAAPISQQTRRLIEENREELEEMTSS